MFGIWVECARDEWDVSDGGVLYLWRWVVFCGTAVRDAVGDVVGDAVGGVVGYADSGIVGKFEYKFVSEWICVGKLLYFILNQWIKFW